MLHLNNHLRPIIRPGFNRSDGIFVYVHEYSQSEVVRTEANLCHKVIKALIENNQSWADILQLHIFIFQTL